MNKQNWDSHFLSLAYFVAQKSKDPSTHIGAVIVDGKDMTMISTGYNGLPRWVDDNVAERNVRPEKYLWYEHAERNAIYQAAKNGIKTYGMTMYTVGTPCCDCARAIIQAGIFKVVVDKRWDDRNIAAQDQWAEHAKRSRTMFSEARVDLEVFDGSLVTKISGRFSGKDIDLA